MAINFPATGGQATDGTFTYTVAGITYAWNGSSWAAAGAGASATNRSLFSVTTNSASGGGALSYDQNSGAFSYTPPDLSGFLTAEADTFQTVTGRGQNGGISITTNLVEFDHPNGVYVNDFGNLNCQNASGGGLGTECFVVQNTASQNSIYLSAYQKVRIGSAPSNGTDHVADFTTPIGGSFTDGKCELFYTPHNGSPLARVETTSTGVTLSGVLTAGGLTYPNSNGTSGQVLTSDGAGNVTWGTAAGSRTTVPVTVNIANEAVSNTSFTTPKTYVLLKVSTSHAAWVTLYSDTGSRTADASRGINVDPLPGSGVLSEVITTGNQVQLITPGTVCFNSAGTGTTYAKIVNKSGSTANITVTLTYVVLES